MFGARPYITLDLCMSLRFFHCSSFIIIHFNHFEHRSQEIVINILELKKLLCNSTEQHALMVINDCDEAFFTDNFMTTHLFLRVRMHVNNNNNSAKLV